MIHKNSLLLNQHNGDDAPQKKSTEIWKDAGNLLNKLDAWEIFSRRFNRIEFKKTNIVLKFIEKIMKKLNMLQLVCN